MNLNDELYVLACLHCRTTGQLEEQKLTFTYIEKTFKTAECASNPEKPTGT